MEWFIKIIVCFLAGAGAGIGTGFAGMSAAAVIAPVLATFLGIPAYEAIGIGLASDVLASAISAWNYKKHGNLDIKNGLFLLVSVLCMTIVGSYIGSLLKETVMNWVTDIALIIIGLRFIIFPVVKTKDQMKEMSKTSRIIKSIIGGCLVGFICGFVGAGGGMMLLFVLTTFLGYEMHMAVGTSVFIMSFTALTGSASHFAIDGVSDYWTLGFCIVFTLLWALFASKIANKVSSKTLNRVVGIVMILTSLIVLTFEYLV